MGQGRGRVQGKDRAAGCREDGPAKVLLPNVVLLPIRLTQDDTQQDKGARRSLKPMYAELGNMRIQRRSELWTQICMHWVRANTEQEPAASQHAAT